MSDQPRDEKLRALAAENAILRNQLRWRPIEEMHEDDGPCVCVHLVNDPAYLEIWHRCDLNFDEIRWTHFVPVPRLSTNEAELLLLAMTQTK